MFVCVGVCACVCVCVYVCAWLCIFMAAQVKVLYSGVGTMMNCPYCNAQNPLRLLVRWASGWNLLPVARWRHTCKLSKIGTVRRITVLINNYHANTNNKTCPRIVGSMGMAVELFCTCVYRPYYQYDRFNNKHTQIYTLVFLTQTPRYIKKKHVNIMWAPYVPWQYFA